MKKYLSLLLLIFGTCFVSCGIEGIEPLRELNPPLGLVASLSSNKILLRFYSSNPESFFSGFNIYIANDETVLRSGAGIKLPNTDFDALKPTIYRDIVPSSNIIIYQITFDEDYDANGVATPFISNLTYVFYVKAYSQEYNISSPPSNIADVIFIP